MGVQWRAAVNSLVNLSMSCGQSTRKTHNFFLNILGKWVLQTSKMRYCYINISTSQLGIRHCLKYEFTNDFLDQTASISKFTEIQQVCNHNVEHNVCRTAGVLRDHFEQVFKC